MKPSDELFKLINSLTKSEKRFFKLSSTLQSGEKNYLKLFDAIEKQKEYDEKGIKKTFRKEKFISHLPSEKNHLYKLILKSLRGYHADNSIGSQLAEEVKNIEILYEKALYKECGKIIRKAKKLAYAHEKFYYLLELIRAEKMLLEEEYLSGNFDKNLDQLINEEQEVIAKLRNVAEYQMLYSQLNFVFRRGGYVRNDKERAIVEKISDYHLIKNKNTAISSRAAATCHYIKGLCAVVNYDYANSFKSFLRVTEIFEKNPTLIQDIPRQYIKSLSNLLFCYMDHGDYKAFYELIGKTRALEDRPGFTGPDIRMKIFTATYNAELVACDKRGEYEGGLELIDDIVAGIEKYQSIISKEEEILFYYHIAYIYFGTENHKDALHWLNKVLNDNEPNLRQDVYSFARLFNLIIHLELENYDLLDYIVKSATRFYVKRKREYGREYKFETVFLKHFGRLSKVRGNKEKMLAIFIELSKEVKKALKDPYERVALEYFDFITWIDSKIEDVPFAESKKNKVASN